jgi:beta-lactamase regulating signal transducer with metallopeptidase domain
MTTLEALLAQPLGQALGWSLLHFLWQGTVIAAVLGALLALARNRSASLRYAMSCGALLLMTAAPVVTFLGYDAAAPKASHEVLQPPVAFEQVTPGPVAPDVVAADLPARFSAWWQERFTTLQPWMVLAWSLGVLLLSLRYLGGWAAAQRLKRRRTRPAAAAWQSTLDRLAARLKITRPVRLLESAAVRVPSALGIWKPVVLVPAASLAGIAPRHLEALLAHELAHVRRHDYLVNLLQSAVETLLFYHPAVWWVSQRARVERENCCDDLAIAATGSASVFARALAELEERRASGLRLQTAADGGLLRRRVIRLLGGPERSEPFPRQIAGVLALSLLLLTGAAFRISSADMAGSGGAAGVLLPEGVVENASNGLASGDPEDECAACETEEMDEAVAAGVKSGIEGAIRGAIAGGIRGAVAAVAPVVPTALAGGYDDVVLAQAATPREKPADSTRPAEGKRADRLTVDQLIAFKVHGVTPEFIQQVEGLGFGRPSPDDLISLRIHGVDPAYIESVRKSWGNLDLEQIVSLKIHGLTPQFADEIKRTGLTGLDFDELLAMKIHGVTPEYVRHAQASGFGKLSADQVVSLKIHGVTSQDVEKWKGLGMPQPDFDQVLSAKIHGVTPEFVGEMRKLGFTDLDLDDVVALKIHGVTTEFVAQVRAAGYTDATADDVTALRIHNVSVADLKAYRAAAPGLSLEDIVSLKIHGFSVEELRRMVRDGRLSLEPDREEN